MKITPFCCPNSH